MQPTWQLVAHLICGRHLLSLSVVQQGKREDQGQERPLVLPGSVHPAGAAAPAWQDSLLLPLLLLTGAAACCKVLLAALLLSQAARCLQLERPRPCVAAVASC